MKLGLRIIAVLIYAFIAGCALHAQSLRGVFVIDWKESTRTLKISASLDQFGDWREEVNIEVVYNIDSTIKKVDEYEYEIQNANVNILLIKPNPLKKYITQLQFKKLLQMLYPSMRVDVAKKEVILIDNHQMLSQLFDELIKEGIIPESYAISFTKEDEQELFSVIEMKMNDYFGKWIFEWVGREFVVGDVELALDKKVIEGFEKVPFPVVRKVFIESWSWLQKHVYIWNKINIDSDYENNALYNLAVHYGFKRDDIKGISLSESYMNKTFYDTLALNECDFLRIFSIDDIDPDYAHELLIENFELRYE